MNLINIQIIQKKGLMEIIQNKEIIISTILLKNIYISDYIHLKVKMPLQQNNQYENPSMLLKALIDSNDQACFFVVIDFYTFS